MSVSKEQRSVVQQFSLKTENFSAYPEKLMTELADIREARGIYYANSFTDPVTHLNELDAIVKERLKDDKIPGRVAVTFKILDQYAEGLVQLSSDAPFKTRSKLYGEFGVDIETLVGYYNQIDGAHPLPAGIGKLLTQSLDKGTKAYLAHKQCKALKKFVSQADTLVSLLCDGMVNFLSSEGMGKLIKAEESGIPESFRFYFTKRSPPSLEGEKEYIELMKRVQGVKQLQGQTIQTIKNLKKAHKELAEELPGRKHSGK